MGDMGDMYKAMNEHSKEKRANNLESSTKMLDEQLIDYESKNSGIHLIVTDLSGELIDFYPSTGKWIPRNGTPSRGIKNLIRHIKKTI